MNTSVHLLISGRVQGVFFRASTKKQALKFGLTGFVRNLPDGRVEVIVAGQSADVEKLTKWCHQGPLGAKVNAVETAEFKQVEEFIGFEVR